jgi:uncharacterized membrane protein HdeD (DUF308 family)
MSGENERTFDQASGGAVAPPLAPQHELQRLRSGWCWLLALGAFLVLCGTLAVVFPAATSVAAASVLGVILLVGGFATIVGSFWAGRWSGFLVQILVGAMYVVAGLAVHESPVVTVLMLTFFMALSFMVLGIVRMVGALIVRFPQWGWAMLNGAVTFLCGLVIYHHLPLDALWVIGLLVGLEMLFNGWTWIMLSIALRKLPKESCT